MNLPASPSESEPRIPAHQTSLARSLIRTLMIFTFIPLTLMAAGAYVRARTLLREQVVGQMQAQLTVQLDELDRMIKIKNIRLDRLLYRPDTATHLETALQADPQSEEFKQARQELAEQMRAINPEVGKAVLNQYFLMKPDGLIRIASNPAWEGSSLQSSPLFEALSNSEGQTLAVYDLEPLYPRQLILITVVQYRTAGGNRLGTLAGITEPQSVQELQELLSLNPSADTYIVTRSGTFIGIDPYTHELTAFEPAESQRAILLPALETMLDAQESRPRSLEFTSATKGAVLAQAAWLPSMQAAVVLEIPQELVFGQLNSLIPFTMALFALSLLAIGAVIWLGTNRVFRPLVSLAEIARRYSEGDFTLRPQIHSHDEIGLLAGSFNRMADELGSLYRSLEEKVEERTRQIRTAAEIAQRITSTTRLDELLNRTVQLLVEQFNFYQASVFLLDRTGKYAVLRASYGPAAQQMLARGHRLEVGSASIIGWVTSTNQPRIASDVAEDPIHLKNELLPETRSEAGIPISVSGQVMGVLDVQSTQPRAFGPETIVMLQTLASQIAVAMQNMRLVEASQVNLQELERLYRASHQIVSSRTKKEALQSAARALRDSPYVAALLTVNDGRLEIEALDAEEGLSLRSAVRNLEVDLEEVRRFLAGTAVIAEASSPGLPLSLTRYTREMNCQSVAFLPILQGGKLVALATLGARTQTLTSAMLQPYVNMCDLVSIALERLAQTEQREKLLAEQKALASISRVMAASAGDLDRFFSELHQEVRHIVGDYAFVVALYDKATRTIRIPYMYEDGRVDKMDAFPLGEGLSSILIRSGKPLLLVEDTERRAAELGAKIVGRPARSWMGAPMLIQGEAIGALIVQDLEREHAFNEDDLRFFSTLADQVAAIIYNTRLLEESRRRALQLETAAEIARDISTSLNLDELLQKAANFIRERLDFYHAAIFLLDPAREFAVIREATGEAGLQMKRMGHKLGVGSKSIVGYVAGQGEVLIVNDTSKDATYYANPLLPETRSEAALPLKVGERILGVLDVQSARPYAFNEDNIRTLQILADQMAVAVINSELFAETQEHLAQHRLLHHITTSAASGTTLEEALESAVNGLQVTLGGDRVAILLMDRERNHLEVKAAVGYSEEILQKRIPLGAGITGWAAAHRRPLRVGDVTTDSRYIQASPNTRSELAVPLIYRNEVLGVLNVESEQPNAYTENDEEMLGTLAGSLAAIIANARLLEQIRQQAERERLLYEITSRIRRSTDMKTILATTASELTKAVGARRTQIRVGLAPQTEETP